MTIPYLLETETTATAIYENWTLDGFRLPSSGEWEYFTRAGTTSSFSVPEPTFTSMSCSSGHDPDHPNLMGVAWYKSNSGGKTHDAESKLPNPWGLYDVHGNVWEWVWDAVANNPIGCITDMVDSRGSTRVVNGRFVRGGGFQSRAEDLKSGNKEAGDNFSLNTIGFRLVRTIQ